LGASIAGTGITVAGSAARMGDSHQAPSRAKGSNTPGKPLLKKFKSAGDRTGGVIGMKTSSRARDRYQSGESILRLGSSLSQLYRNDAVLAHTFSHMSVKPFLRRLAGQWSTVAPEREGVIASGTT
jgi:hypothetical protein